MIALKTLQYNIYSTPLDNMFPAREKETFERIKYIKNLVQKINTVDIITLNESHGKKTTSWLLQGLKKEGFKYNTNILGETKKLTTCKTCNRNQANFLSLGIINGGVMIISKHPVIRECEFIFKNYRTFLHRPSTATADCLARKGCLFAKIKIQNKFIVNIIATHLQAWPGKVFDKVRLKQLKEIRFFVNKLKKNKIIQAHEPIIYQGDFNIDYYKYKNTLSRMCYILNAKIPKIIGNHIFSSDPTSNYLVETVGWNAPIKISNLITNWKRKIFNKTRKKRRCKHFIPLKKIINNLTRKINKYAKYYKDFEEGICQISKRVKLDNECYSKYSRSELLDYILYDVGNLIPAKSSITIIDPKEYLDTKKEISDHYPLFAEFVFCIKNFKKKL